MASPAAFEPDPLVTLVRWRTVAEVDSIGLVVRRWIQCSAGLAVEREQLVHVVGDLRGRFGELGAVGQFEGGHGAVGVVAVLGVPDLG
jgi:hypothetical protein